MPILISVMLDLHKEHSLDLKTENSLDLHKENSLVLKTENALVLNSKTEQKITTCLFHFICVT